jgi:kynurenine formamidase
VDCTGLDPRDAIGREALPGPTDHDLLAIHTGWSEHWGTDRYRDHPYLTESAAAWCGEHGYSVGLDTFGPDPTPSADPARERAEEPEGYPAHDALFSAECLVVENLTGLDGVPTEFELTALPLALATEASPVRAVARW